MSEPLSVFPYIEDRLQLHQEVTIIYVVDGFEATFYTGDGTKIATGIGDTVYQAMASLENQMKNVKL